MTTLRAPSVLVEEGAHAASGEVATLTVHVRNLAAEPVDLRLSLVGLEPAWVPEAFTVPAVRADETVTVALPVTPVAGAAPGDYPCVVAVEALVDGVTARTLADATVRVDGESELLLSVEPVEARAVRSAAVDVVLVNASDAPAQVHLHATGREGLQVAVPAVPVTVGPRETVRVGARVRAPRVRLVGPRRRIAYTVTATGRQAPRHVQAAVSVRPLVTSGFARAVAVVAALALWATSVFTVLPYLAERFSDRSTSVENLDVQIEAGEDTGGPGGEDGSGGAGGAGGEDGSGEAGDDGSPGAGAELVRVAGQVTGPSPAGVTVSVVPAASLWQPAEDEQDEAQALGARLGEHLAAVLERTHPLTAAVGYLARVAAQARPAAPAYGKTFGLAFPLAPTDGAVDRMSVVSDEKGQWALAGLSPSTRYLVSLSKPGFQTQRVLRTGAELAAAPLETELRAGTGRLSGTVTGPEGPAGGVEVTISDGTTTVTTRTATEGVVGRWQVDGLATPATYLVTAGSDRLGAQSRLVRLAPSGVRAVDLRLRPGLASAAGVVVGKGSLGGTTGLGGLTVTASDGTTTRTATTATGEEGTAGTFVLPDLPVPATYTVTVSGTGYKTRTQRLRLGPAGAQDLRISMNVEGGTVTGTVTGTDGLGIAGAGLTLSSEEHTFRTMSESGGKGTFLFSGIPAGSYILTVQSFGYVGDVRQVEVTDGRTSTARFVLEALPNDGLEATGSVTGRVTDAVNGGHVTCDVVFDAAGCVVTASLELRRLDGSRGTLTTQRAPEDPYLLPEPGGEGLPPGRYTVHLSAPGYEPGSVQVTVGMGQQAEAATVALVPSPSLTGTVIPRVGTLPSGTCVVVLPVVDGQVQDPTGGAPNPCATAAAECDSFTSRCVLVQNGSYTVDRLRAGTYEVSFRNVDPGYQTPAPRRLVLSPGELRRYDVTVERLGVINLTVLEALDAGSVVPVDVVTVRATRTGGDEEVTLTTSNGAASLRSLQPGTWRLAVVDPNGGPDLVSSLVGIDLNQEVAAQLVITRPVSTFDFLVGWQKTDGDATPVEGARVSITGVTRYVGTFPSKETAVFVTDAQGVARLCTAAADCRAGETALALVDRVVDVRIEAEGFQPVLWSGVVIGEVAEAVLRPVPIPFEGRAVILPDVDGTGYSGVTFEVLSAPPGTGQVSLSVNDAGVVSISDSASSAGNRIRPGHWEIEARRTGHTPALVVLDPEPAQEDAVTAQWTLRRYGTLVVHVKNGAETEASLQNVRGAEVSLSLGEEQLGTVMTDAQGRASFGSIAPGTYQVTVKAAGFEHKTEDTVTVAAGRPADPPWEIVLNRLGAISGTTVSRLTPSMTERIADAEVTAERQLGPGEVESFGTRSGPEGRYRVTGALGVEGLHPGTWHLTASAVGYETMGTPVDVALSSGEQATDVDLELTPRPSELTVVVRDGEDLISGLQVVMWWRDGATTRYVEPCVPEPGLPNDPCRNPGPGEYRFLNLLPVTYNISVSGGGYLSTTVPVTVEIDTVATFPLALTAPGGSVQGSLVQRTGSGGQTPLVGRTVELTPTGQDPSDTTPAYTAETTSVGHFSFRDVPAGEYWLVAKDGSEELVRRVVSVASGQSTVVDLVIDATLLPARVVVTSVNGTDLTGAQVTLEGTPEGESTTLTYGPATLLRRQPGENVFVATFPQLPPGTWTPTVTGPAGHLGSHTGTPQEVDASSTDVTVSVREREVRLRATGGAGSQHTLTARLDVGPGPAPLFSVNQVLTVGASDVVLFVPERALALSATAPAGWQYTVSPSGTVPSGSTPVLFTVAVTAVPQLTLCTATPVIYSDFTCTVQLTMPPGASAAGRTIRVQVGGGQPETHVTSSTGAVDVLVEGAVVGASAFTIQAAFEAAPEQGLAGVTAQRSYTPQGQVDQLQVSLCTGNAVQGQNFSCSIMLSGPSGFSVGGRTLAVEASRDGVAFWSGTVTTGSTPGSTGQATAVVPASGVGTQAFTLTVTWDIPGMPAPVTASREVTVSAGNPGGPPGGPPGQGG